MQAGDVVEIKSGGTQWTIARIDGEKADCVRDGRGMIFRETFELVLLKPFVKGPGPFGR